MNWTNIEDFNEEDNDVSFPQSKSDSEKMQTEEEDKRTIQLKKYQDPTNNPYRQSVIALVNRFGDLLVKHCIDEIAKDMMAENSECFFFNFLDGESCSYAIGNQHFGELYKGARI